ncbi:hypothetical protein ACIBI3_06910 [Actinomadura luteofluorescens]|uniref:hypothetical protein n=1 Tax=Actinomadura luteofluorescens TaxID=46163 RepID=UPI00349824CB
MSQNSGNAARNAGIGISGFFGACIGGAIGVIVGVLLGLILGATVSVPVGIVTGACVAGFGFLSGIVVAVRGARRVGRSISARGKGV